MSQRTLFSYVYIVLVKGVSYKKYLKIKTFINESAY